MSLKIEAAVTPTIVRLADFLELHDALTVSKGRFQDERATIIDRMGKTVVADFFRIIDQVKHTVSTTDVVNAAYRVIDERRAYRLAKIRAAKQRLEELRRFNEEELPGLLAA